MQVASSGQRPSSGEANVDVSVSISQELRNLRRTAHGKAEPKHQDPALSGAVSSQPVAQHRLRRDGAQPLRFTGVQIFEVRTSAAHSAHGFDHGISFFKTNTGKLVTALWLVPSTALALRPAYWAKHTQEQADVDLLLRHWCQDVLAVALNCASPAPPTDALTALHSLTAHVLRVALPQTERKETCLQ